MLVALYNRYDSRWVQTNGWPTNQFTGQQKLTSIPFMIDNTLMVQHTFGSTVNNGIKARWFNIYIAVLYRDNEMQHYVALNSFNETLGWYDKCCLKCDNLSLILNDLNDLINKMQWLSIEQSKSTRKYSGILVQGCCSWYDIS